MGTDVPGRSGATYTNYTFDSDYVGYMVDKNLFNCKIGLIHSHNSMPTFFSGEDMDELQTNVGNHNTYLSLIVNNRMETCAKLAVKGKVESSQRVCSLLDPDGEEVSVRLLDDVEEVMFTYDCDIQLPASFEKDFLDRVAHITKPKVPVQTTLFTPKTTNVGVDDKVEKYFIQFLGGSTIKNTLDKVLTGFKYSKIYEPEKFIAYLNQRGLKIYGPEDEHEIIEEVTDMLYPYQFKNVEQLKEKYDLFLLSLETEVKTTTKSFWDNYG